MHPRTNDVEANTTMAQARHRLASLVLIVAIVFLIGFAYYGANHMGIHHLQGACQG